MLPFSVSNCSEASTYIYITVQVSIGLYLLYGLVGSSMFAGLTVLIVSGPVTVIMCKFAHKFRDTCMKTKDKRIKIINETLSAIKVRENFQLLKFPTW